METSYLTSLCFDRMRLCVRLTDFDVSRGKNALITKLALAQNGTTALCNEIGQQMLLEGYRTPFNKMAKDIQVSIAINLLASTDFPQQKIT